MSELASAISLRPSHRPQLPDGIVAQLNASIKPGDVFITRKEFALTNYFLPGYWPHAALYLGDASTLEQRGVHQHEHVTSRWDRLRSLDRQQPGRVMEALKDGVSLRSVASPFASDSLVVLRPLLAPEFVTTALARSFAHDGKPYDFDFDFTRGDRLVCTEVVYRAYDGIEGVQFELTRRAGRMTLAAGDLIRMAQARRHFKIHATYVGDDADRLLTDQQVEAAVAKRLDAEDQSQF